jgi:tetratricopeptide (TPR) repeat protein
MAPVPLAARVVEVIADRGATAHPRFRYGSGFIVRAGTVLTAAHVVAGAVSVSVRDPDKRVFSASADPRFTGDPAGPGPDLALLEIDHPAPDLPPVGLARVDRDSPSGEPVRDCQVIGYPAFKEQDTPDGGQVRETADATGHVPVLEGLAGGLLSVHVTHGPRPLPPKETALGESEWSGMSGAPLLAGGLLLGVVSEHAPREGSSAITAIALTALEADPAHLGWGPGVTDPAAWWDRLGVPGMSALRRLPPRPDRAVWPTLNVVRPRPMVPAVQVVGDRVSAAVDVFRDRVEFLARLRGLVLAREKPIICVTGRRGIGKSGLVAKVLAEFEEPADTTGNPIGGLAYLSTRTGVGVLDLARIFHALTRLLPQDQGDRLEQAWANAGADALPDLLSALRARNAVLVLDNLDDLQDPNTGELTNQGLISFLTAICRNRQPPVVVTTSQHPVELPLEIFGHFAVLEIDDGLDADEAVELLRHLDADNRAGLRDLPYAELLQAAERVYRMPRGLEWWVALMARRKTATLRRLLDAQDTPEALLGQLVSEGFHSLDELGRDVVRVLALADTPLPADALPQMLALEHPPAAVTQIVERLAETHVIGFERATGRARLHPIDSDYVRGTLLTDQGKRAGLDLRLADWLSTQRTDPRTWRTSSDVGPQRREIRHRLRAGDGHGAIRIMADIAEFLARHGEGDQLADALDQAVRYADTPATRAAYELSRGSVASYAGSLNEAIDAFRAARNAAEGTGDRMLTALVDSWLGMALRMAGNAEAALGPLERASTLPVTDQASRVIVVGSLSEAGLTACYLGDVAKAEEAAARIEAELREEDSPQRWGQLADLRALIALLQGDYTRALTEVERGIVCYVESPYQDVVGYLVNIRGLVLLAQGRATEAAREFIAVREDAATVHYVRLQGVSALNLAWSQLCEGNRQAASATAREAANLLAASRVRETESAQALAAACEAGDVDTMLQRLHLAVSASHGNPDLYQPSDRALAALAADLSIQRDSSFSDL